MRRPPHRLYDGFDHTSPELQHRVDYCSPPLAMERAAVLDSYFDDIQVEAVKAGEGWSRIQEMPRLFSSLPGQSTED